MLQHLGSMGPLMWGFLSIKACEPTLVETPQNKMMNLKMSRIVTSNCVNSQCQSHKLIYINVRIGRFS